MYVGSEVVTYISGDRRYMCAIARSEGFLVSKNLILPQDSSSTGMPFEGFPPL